jgi:hypothetical protein
MRGIIDNEYKVIEKILNAESSKDWTIGSGKVVLLLAKHYYSLEGEKATRETIFEHINSFIKTKMDKYSPKKWADLINNVIDTVVKNEWYEPIRVEKIEITKVEWENILELDNTQLEKVAFAILCYVKMYKARSSSKDRVDDLAYILMEAGLRGSLENKLLFADLRDKGYLQLGTAKHMYAKPLYINEESEPYIIIDNFDKIITYYDEFKNGVKYKVCSRCNGRFKETSKRNNSTFCGKCSKK